jgi:hypothetical protein
LKKTCWPRLQTLSKNRHEPLTSFSQYPVSSSDMEVIHGKLPSNLVNYSRVFPDAEPQKEQDGKRLKEQTTTSIASA